MQLNWKSHLDLSAMHAAWCADRFGDRARCSSDLRQAAGDLAKLTDSMAVPISRFWDVIVTLSVDCQRNQDLADRTLRKLVSGGVKSPSLSARLVAQIATVENVFRMDFPNYADEIILRTEPLKQLWEGHGPGLLLMLGRFTDPALLVDSADVYLVQPIVGGLGYAHLQTNRVHLEGMLTDADARLPETIRLAWLLSQLDFERPLHSEKIHASNLRRIAGLSMIPPTLMAAAELGLCDFSVESVRRAIELWQVDVADAQSAVVAEVLMTWWETFDASRPGWGIALTGLDRML